jgi:hypothetical protein
MTHQDANLPLDLRDPGEVPVLDWIDKGAIDVDDRYQRGLDEARVDRILASFAWDSFGAVVIAPAAEGRYHCIDGQHRLEAAKRHPKVDHVPAVIITSRPVEGEAATFVTVNRDRKNVSQLEMYWAELTAGHPDAQTVAQVAERTGIRILRSATPAKDTKPGDTMAIGTIRSLVERLGSTRARIMLGVLSSAELAPICSHHIRAIELLMTDPEFRDLVDADGLLDAILGSDFESEGKVFAATHCVPHWRGFASVWFKNTKKKRRPTPAPEMSTVVDKSPAPSARPVRVAPVAGAAVANPKPANLPKVSTKPHRTIVPHSLPGARVVTGSLCGDPAPGRSALDQRKERA